MKIFATKRWGKVEPWTELKPGIIIWRNADELYGGGIDEPHEDLSVFEEGTAYELLNQEDIVDTDQEGTAYELLNQEDAND